ncbi:MAG: hypothetical protein ACXIUD_08985 [Mongoliitalea sp.]
MLTDEELKEEREKIIKGLEETYRRMIEFKKAKNSPIIVVREGKIVALDPFDVPATTTYKRKTE